MVKDTISRDWRLKGYWAINWSYRFCIGSFIKQLNERITFIHRSMWFMQAIYNSNFK